MSWRAALKLGQLSLKALLTREKPNDSGYTFFGHTQAGQPVDEERALRYSAVWGCVRIISETIATLPWQVFQKTRAGRKEVASDLAWLLQTQPNTEMSPFVFKELMVRRMLLCGNGYAEIQRDNGGRAVALWPICSDRVYPRREDDGSLVYYVRDIEQGIVDLDPANVFHLKGPGGDGIVGYSIIRMAAESIGLGLAMQDFGASFFGNGANMGGALKHPKQLSTEARKNLEESVRRRAGGKNSLSTIVLEEGMDYVRIGIPPEDAQFLESRNAQVRDICRWYRVPPHKVADLSDAKWANIEFQSIDFVTDAIIPTVTRMEQEANLKLFGRNNRGTMYTKLNIAALLRGDMTSRYTSYAVGRQWGWLSANDVRELEDLNPVPGGNLYLVPANMTTPQLLKEGPQKPAEPDPNPPDPTQAAMKALRDRRKLNGHAHA